MGFIEETGAARYLRDARIAPIYEGTNGIQAIDLVTRKLPLSDGDHVRGFIAELDAISPKQVRSFQSRRFRRNGRTARCGASPIWKRRPSGCLQALADGKTAEALSGATPYQRLFGLALTGVYLAKGGLADGGDGADEKPHRALPLCRRKPACPKPQR